MRPVGKNNFVALGKNVKFGKQFNMSSFYFSDILISSFFYSRFILITNPIQDIVDIGGPPNPPTMVPNPCPACPKKPPWTGPEQTIEIQELACSALSWQEGVRRRQVQWGWVHCQSAEAWPLLRTPSDCLDFLPKIFLFMPYSIQ